MTRKVRYTLHEQDRPYDHVLICMLAGIMMLMGICSFYSQLSLCHRSIFSLSTLEVLQNSSFSKCSTSYDKCLCSVTSNKFNSPSDCIDIVYDMAGRILPPLEFILQIYIVYQLFLLGAINSHLLRNLLLAIAVLGCGFIITVGYINMCVYLYTIYGLGLVVFTQPGYLSLLMMCNPEGILPHRSCKTCQAVKSYEKSLIIAPLCPQ